MPLYQQKKTLTNQAINHIINMYQSMTEEFHTPTQNTNGNDTNNNGRRSNIVLSDSSDDETTYTNTFDLKTIKKEIKMYQLEAKCDDILRFWGDNETKYPMLFRISSIIFSAPSTSTPSERMFSNAGYQCWDRRNKLGPERMEQIVFISENQHI